MTVDELFACLAAADREFDGETVDLLAHGLQCAALLADRRRPTTLELQVAGLVHDVGTIVAPGQSEPPRPHRRRRGAARSSATASPPSSAATTRPSGTSSPPTPPTAIASAPAASPHSAVQGGLLDPTERAAFERRPEFDALLALRRADDAAKEPRAAPSTCRSSTGVAHGRRASRRPTAG